MTVKELREDVSKEEARFILALVHIYQDSISAVEGMERILKDFDLIKHDSYFSRLNTDRVLLLAKRTK